MDFFRRPNISRMVEDNDREGLYSCLEHHDRIVRLQAAQALARLGDGAGWRVLIEWVGLDNDPDIQEGAAAILGELGTQSFSNAHRAIPPLGAALKKARDETATIIRDALLSIGGVEAEEALRQAGYTPTSIETTSEVTDYDAHFIRPVLPDSSEVEFISAEAHLNTAIDLLEHELTERGLVECNLALWLKPEWDYAWYLKGVLFEDLERPYEAWLAYRRAISLNPLHEETIEAIDELEHGQYQLLPLEFDQLIQSATGGNWKERRDAAAGLGELLKSVSERSSFKGNIDGVNVQDLLISMLEDEEREVRSAAVIALGYIQTNEAVEALKNHVESSWLIRFSIIDALARLKNLEGLVSVLEYEMERMMERNPTFSSHRDPLVEVEYERLLEIGVLALEQTGDINGLLDIAEGNAWVETDEEDGLNVYTGGIILSNEEAEPGKPDDQYDADEAEEDLSSYVDEVSQMVCMALDRAARPLLSTMEKSILERLAVIPDLTLVDIESLQYSETDDEEYVASFDEKPTALVYDLASLRESARSELVRRGLQPSN